MKAALRRMTRASRSAMTVSARPPGCAARSTTATRLIHIEEYHDVRTQTSGGDDLEAPG